VTAQQSSSLTRDAGIATTTDAVETSDSRHLYGAGQPTAIANAELPRGKGEEAGTQSLVT